MRHPHDNATDIAGHQGHHLEYRETVATPYVVHWIKNGQGWSPERGLPIETKAQMIANDLYCVDCDVYLSGWEL